MRSEAKASMQESYEAKEVIQDYIRYKLVHFQAHMGFWEGFTREQAEGAFYELLAEQSEHENSDGEPTVLVKDRERVRRVSGNRTGTQTTTSSSSASGLNVASGSGQYAMGGAGRGSVAGRSECGEDASVKRPLEAHDEDDDDECDDGGASTLQPSPAKPVSMKNAAKSRRLTVDALKAHLASGGASGSQVGEQGTQVHMLKSRSELQKEAKEALAEATSAKSPFTVLGKKIKSTPTERIDDMEEDPRKVLSAIKASLIDPLQSLQESTLKLALKEVAPTKVRHWGNTFGTQQMPDRPPKSCLASEGEWYALEFRAFGFVSA